MMGSDCFLCIDAGTTRFKTAAITAKGETIARSDYTYALKEEFHHEYSAGDLMNALSQTMQHISAVMDTGKIRGIGITGHGPTLMPVNGEGSPIFAAVGYLDDRVKKYVQRLADRKTDRITSTMYIPIALFFKEELPRVYERTYRFLQSFDYIAYRLTGNFVATSSTYGIKPWDRAKVEKTGLDTDKFPTICYMGSEIGHTVKEAMRAFGIPGGIPVFAIGVDFAAALVGTNTLMKGRSCERAGSSGGINLCWDRSIDDTRLLCYRHFIKNCWNIAGITSTYGKAVEWVKRILGESEFEMEMKGDPSNIIFFPYLKGERTPLWNPFAKGILFGIDDSHDKTDLILSIYLGIAFSMRDCIEIIEENGCEFRYPIITTGGGARREWFVQLKSDVTGKEFAKVQTDDAELLGMGVILAHSMGLYSDLVSAVQDMVREKKLFKPRKKKFLAYSKLFELYRELREELSGYF